MNENVREAILEVLRRQVLGGVHDHADQVQGGVHHLRGQVQLGAEVDLRVLQPGLGGAWTVQLTSNTSQMTVTSTTSNTARSTSSQGFYMKSLCARCSMFFSTYVQTQSEST